MKDFGTHKSISVLEKWNRTGTIQYFYMEAPERNFVSCLWCSVLYQRDHPHLTCEQEYDCRVQKSIPRTIKGKRRRCTKFSPKELRPTQCGVLPWPPPCLYLLTSHSLRAGCSVCHELVKDVPESWIMSCCVPFSSGRKLHNSLLKRHPSSPLASCINYGHWAIVFFNDQEARHTWA